MKHSALTTLLLAVAIMPVWTQAEAQQSSGKSFSKAAEANKQRLVIDDMEDVSDWTNGSPEETTISASTEHVRQGRFSLKFANLVDYTKGEKNYPVGWPRTSKRCSSTSPSRATGTATASISSSTTWCSRGLSTP